MSQRIRVGRNIQISPSIQKRHVADLTRRLKGVRLNYRFELMDKRRAKMLGRRIIEDHYQTLLRLTKGYLGYALKRSVSLSPEDQRRLDQWRDEAIRDFEAIIDDTR